MQLNLEKCVVLHVYNKKTVIRTPYFIGSSIIEAFTDVKYLGIAITNNLNWNSHIDNITKSALNSLWSLKCKFTTAMKTVKLVANKTLIRPRLESVVQYRTLTQEQILLN